MQMGKQLAPVPSLEQVLEQQIRPAAAAQGNSCPEKCQGIGWKGEGLS